LKNSTGGAEPERSSATTGDKKSARAEGIFDWEGFASFRGNSSHVELDSELIFGVTVLDIEI